MYCLVAVSSGAYCVRNSAETQASLTLTYEAGLGEAPEKMNIYHMETENF